MKTFLFHFHDNLQEWKGELQKPTCELQKWANEKPKFKTLKSALILLHRSG
jgi:hypothetical protein